MLNIEDIINLSTENSFSRGENYYKNGYVQEITRIGSRFEGTVAGSMLYKVILDTENEDLKFQQGKKLPFQ